MSKQVLRFLKESNAIEGVYDAEYLLLAYDAWTYLIKQKELTPEVIKKTHQLLMRNSGLEEHEIGNWRDVEVSVGGRLGKPSYAVPTLMELWCERINKLDDLDYKNFHIQYEHIHPFVDGNGRTGRMFMNWHRRNMCLPILIIEEKQKQNYYSWFYG